MRQTAISAILLPALGLLGAATAAASELPTEVASAVEKLQRAASVEWSYVRTGESEAQLLVERYTHGAEDPWELLSIDGTPATERQRKAYSKKADERVNRDHPGKVDILSMIETDSLQLLDESEQHAVYGFQPAPDDNTDAEFAKALVGKLRLDRVAGVVQSLQMSSSEPFSPRTGVRIERMLMRMVFSPPEASRPGFLTAIRNDVDAKIAGIKSIEQRQSVRFHDFEHPE